MYYESLYTLALSIDGNSSIALVMRNGFGGASVRLIILVMYGNKGIVDGDNLK
jgi:hypothetical protein